MLFSLSVPVEAGYSSIYTNIGDMRNAGLEIDLGADIFRTKDFLWSVNLNMTHYKNKVTYLPEERKTMKVDGYEGYSSGNYFYGEDLSLYTFHMKKYAGVNENGESLFYKNIKDSDGNVTGRETTTSYSDADYYLCGTALPDVYGGFGTSVRYKGLDFSIDFAYQIGGQAYDSGYASMMGSPMTTSVGFALHRDLWDAWTPENNTSNIPRFYYSDEYTNATSSRFLTDASYLNIQNITVGYTLPRNITRKFLVEALRIYVVCDNVWYWSRRKGLDPRQSFSGATNPYYYAPIRTISGGVSITF
jgi:hypothetical protein